MSAPIELTLYGKDDEIKGEYSKKIVSWGLLKRAIRLSEMIDEGDQAPEQTDWLSRFRRWLRRNEPPITSEEKAIDQISQFVVDVFDGHFTVKDLEEGAEISEILTVLRAVVGRAKMMDPTKPPKARPRH